MQELPPVLFGRKDCGVKSLHRKIGEILECRIDGHPTKLRRVRGHYDKKGNRSKCPICGGLGMAWSGMFHCESVYAHKAVIPTGQCFVVVGEGKAP